VARPTGGTPTRSTGARVIAPAVTAPRVANVPGILFDRDEALKQPEITQHGGWREYLAAGQVKA